MEKTRKLPFDLEAALRGEKVMTKDGSEVTQIVYYPKAMYERCVFGLLDDTVWGWSRDGKRGEIEMGFNDLFMVKTYHTAPIVVNKYTGEPIACRGCSCADPKVTKTVQAEYEY
jgi:hypothetical protein